MARRSDRGRGGSIGSGQETIGGIDGKTGGIRRIDAESGDRLRWRGFVTDEACTDQAVTDHRA